MAVPSTDPERVRVPVVGQEDGAGSRRGDLPVRPCPAIRCDLDVEAGDRALVAPGPADLESGTPLRRREGDDPRGRSGGVAEELVGQRPIQLRTRSVVPEGPDPGAPEARPVDQVVAELERLGIIEIELAPGCDAAVRRRAGLLLVDGPRGLLDRVVAPPVLGGEIGGGPVDGRDRRPVLGPGDVVGVQGVRVRGPCPAVVRNAEDQLRGRDARCVGRHGVGQIVDRPAQRADGTDLGRRGASIVVAHDEDRVRATRCGRCLKRIVSDPAGRVEGQLVARSDRIEFGANAPDERGEFVRISRDDRLEIEVDAISTALRDGRGYLPGQVGPGGRTPQQRALRCLLAGRPGKDTDGEHDPGTVLMRSGDDRAELGTRPARPARRDAAVRVLFQEVAVLVGTDAEIGDRGQDGPVVGGRTIRELPVRQEPEDFAPQPVGRNGGAGVGPKRGHARATHESGVRPGYRGTDRAVCGRLARGRSGAGFSRSALRGGTGPDRPLLRLVESLAADSAGGQGLWRCASHGPRIAGPGRESHGDDFTRFEVDDIGRMGEGILIVDRQRRETRRFRGRRGAGAWAGRVDGRPTTRFPIRAWARGGQSIRHR